MTMLVAQCVWLGAGCSQSTSQVGGPYVGYFGAEFSNSKVGVSGVLEQQGNKLGGVCTLSAVTRNQKSIRLECTLDGEIQGDKVQLKFHGKSDKAEIEMQGQWHPDGTPRIQGVASLKSGSADLEAVWKTLKSQVDTAPFLWKSESKRS
jgi:hypothetical protein